MNIKLSNRQTIAVLAGSFFLAIAIGSGVKLLSDKSQHSAPVASSPETADPEVASAANPPSQFFEQPFLEVGSGLRLAEPVLLQSTSKEERVISVAAGRSNPFAPITRPGASTPRRNQAASQPPAPSNPPQNVPTVPVVATQTLPPLPSLPTASPSVSTLPLPTVAVAPNLQPLPADPTAMPLPALEPTSPVDKIEISGVVQLGGRVRVIIREAGASTSRHVTIGDRLVGGQVRIKDVDLSGAEPLVVLEYNGQEFYRSVGSTALAGLS